MDPEEKPASLRRAIVRIVCIVGVLMVLYALSVGPFVYYTVKHYTERKLVIADKAYRPLAVFADKTGTKPLLEAYVAFWLGLAGEPQ
jgi:hypothetical protein